MARTSLLDVQSLVDPLLTYNFDLVFPFIPGSGGAFSRGMTIRCLSAALPGMQIEPVTVGLHGIEVNYAGRQIFNKQFTAVFHETRDLAVRQAIRGWIEFQRNNPANTGNYKGVGGVNGYAVNAILILYDDIPNEIQRTTIVNTFPVTIDDLTMEGNSSTAAQYNVTLQYDYTVDVFTPTF